MIRLACIACLLASPVSSMAQTLAVRAGDGAILGFYTGPGTAAPSGQWGHFRIVSSTGYGAVFNAKLGTMPGLAEATPTADGGPSSDRILFASSDCSGQGYIEVPTIGGTDPALGLFAAPGFVFRAGPTTYELWYVAKDAVAFPAGPLGAQIQGKRFDGICSAGAAVPPEGLLYPAAPNDPGITGLPNSPAVPPLTVEPVPVSAVFSIFRDSFESPQASIAREGMIDAALAKSHYS